VHSLVDGIVIGGSFRVSATIGARVAVAIVLHKIPDGFVVASLLTATNRSRKPLWVLALSSITPIGAVAGYAVLTGIPARLRFCFSLFACLTCVS
jgi:zinc transporter ZupT